MIFEVKKINGKRVFFTNQESCIPNDIEKRALLSAGYKLYKDKKVYKMPTVSKSKKSSEKGKQIV